MSQPFDAVIGLPLLALVGWEVDQDHHRIRFFASGAHSIKDGVEVHVGADGSRLLTTIKVNGRQITPVMIDTGSDATLSLTQATADEIGFRQLTDMKTMGLGGAVVQPLGRLDDVAIGSSHAIGVYATSGEGGWFSPSKAVIGMGVLQSYNMVVDVPVGKMQLTKRVTPVPPAPKSTFGIQGMYASGKLTIMHVMKNSPAAAVGLTEGDQICGLNGTPMSQQLFNSHWGVAAPGTRYAVTLCDGTSRSLVLKSFY